MKTFVALVTVLMFLPAAFGQEPVTNNAVVASAALPDAPGTASGQSSSPALPGGSDSSTVSKESEWSLGILPNLHSVAPGETPPPQTVREKFAVGFTDSFDGTAFVYAGLKAGLGQATNSYPAFRQGAAGYGRYYWHSFADLTDQNLLVQSILPSVTHEDNRYYILGRGGVLKRFIYAASRVVITRSDSGTETFNASEIIGNGAAAGISSAYYPTQYRTWTKTGQRWIASIGVDGGIFVVKEFWPDVRRKLFRRNN
jgi:hypothetical protein